MNTNFKTQLLDNFGRRVVADVRDPALEIAMHIAMQQTSNPIKKDQYSVLENLDHAEQEAVCDLLSETITDTLYRFLEMIEEHPDEMKLQLLSCGKCYNSTDLSEKMGSEIACFDDNGWIQKYSTIGRFVL